MKIIKVTARVNIVERKGFDPRFNMIVELPDQNVQTTRIGKNYSTMELTPSKALTLADVQYLLLAKGQSELLNTTKNFRFKDLKAEVGIGHYKESGDAYYFVRVYLLDDLVKTCYLSPSQIKNLKYVDLGYEFEEDPEFVIDDDSIDFGNVEEKKTKKA